MSAATGRELEDEVIGVVEQKERAVSVIVQYIVKVPDVNRFVATSEKYAPTMEEMGSRNGSVYEDENEPGLMSTMSEWDSHDQMHANFREGRR